MEVFRVHKTENYTTMSNHHLRNKTLSLKAKGLMSLLLSLPADWKCSILGLAALSRDGKDSVMSAISELKEQGYVVIRQLNKQDGTFCGNEFHVYEVPQTEKPDAENPNAEKPDAENPPLLNTNSINHTIPTSSDSTILNKESTNKINTKKDKRKSVDLSFVHLAENAAYKDALIKWFEYKKSIGDMYKTDTGAKQALADLKKACGTDCSLALPIVEYCIGKEWKGIYDCKRNLQINGTSTTISGYPTERTEHGNRYSRMFSNLESGGLNT